MKQHEHYEQVAVFEWAAYHEREYPELNLVRIGNLRYTKCAETHTAGRFYLKVLRLFTNKHISIVGKAPPVIGIRPVVCFSNHG